MDLRIILRLAPYAVILGLCFALWSSITWGQKQKAEKQAAEIQRAAQYAIHLAASQAAEKQQKEREHAIADAIAAAREQERQAAAANDARLRAAVAAERRDAGRLREQLAADLGRACQAAADPAAAGDSRAAAIADVLAEALRVQAELAAAAERHAAEVRALQRAWPTQ